LDQSALKLEPSVGNLELGVHLPAPVDVGQLVSCLVMTPDTAGWLGFNLTAAPADVYLDFLWTKTCMVDHIVLLHINMLVNVMAFCDQACF